jgi:hypothetical protein
MVFDAASKPQLDFRLNPPHGSRADTDPARKPAFGFELVDHRASETCDFADLW